jgi:hypothetical protein
MLIAGGIVDAHLFVVGLLAVVGLWVVVSASVIVGRVRYDRRAGALPRFSRTAVYRILADRSVTSERFVRAKEYAVERWGPSRIWADACDTRRSRKWRRIPALIALARMRADGIHELLEQALHQPDRDVVGAAVVALARIGDRDAARILIAALVRESYPPSRIATELDQFKIAIEDLLRPLLSNSKPQIRYWGVTLLRRSRDIDSLATEVAWLAGDAHPPTRKAVVETLVAMRASSAGEVAERLLGDSVFYVRAAAARALAAVTIELALDQHKRAGNVAKLLADRDWHARQGAKAALVTMGPAIWREVAVHLQSDDRFARDGATEVLRDLGVHEHLVDQTPVVQKA